MGGLPWGSAAKSQALTSLTHEHRKGTQGCSQNYAEAAKWYGKAAEQNNAEAQLSLGNMYLTGQGVARDHAEAVKWYRRAADQGKAAAQSNLGNMYFAGQGVPRDIAEAIKWWRKAADQGNGSAQRALADALRWIPKGSVVGVSDTSARVVIKGPDARVVVSDADAKPTVSSNGPTAESTNHQITTSAPPYH